MGREWPLSRVLSDGDDIHFDTVTHSHSKPLWNISHVPGLKYTYFLFTLGMVTRSASDTCTLLIRCHPQRHSAGY